MHTIFTKPIFGDRKLENDSFEEIARREKDESVAQLQAVLS
jgi:hypothetical protein